MKPTNLTTESNSSFNMKKFYFVAALTALMTLLAPCAWGEDNSWTYSIKNSDAVTNNAITMGDVNWSVNTTKGKGNPTISNTYKSQQCLKFGDGKKSYFSNIVFSTDYFSKYKVKQVEIKIRLETDVETKVVVKQSDIEMGSATYSQSGAWYDMTANTTVGTGGTLSIGITTTHIVYISYIKVTYEAATTQTCTTPTFAISDKTITLSDGTLVLDDATLSPNKGGSTGTITYTLPSSVSSSEAEIDGTDFYGYVAGTYQVTATMAADDTYCETSTTFNIKVVSGEIQKYTITWSAPSGNTTSTITAGDALVLPTTTPAAPGGCPDKVFVGWSATNIGNTPSSTAPEFVSSSTIPTASTTYYAVFADKSGGTTSDWTLVTSESDLVAGGTYTIASTATANKGYCLGTKATSNYQGKDWSSSSPIELTLGGTTDKWTFYDAAAGGYLYAASSSSNNLKVQTTNDANGQWKITISTSGDVTIVAQGANTRNSIRYNSSNSLFSCYSTGQSSVYLFKKAAGYTDYVTQCADCTTPQSPLSFTVNATTANLGEDGTVAVGFTWAEGNGSEPTYTITPTTGCTINGKQLVFSAAGTYTITARQDLATVGGVTYCGDKASQTITITKDPVFGSATIDKNTFDVACGDTTSMNSAATITLGTNYNLTKDITVAAPEGFLVSTNKTDNSKYASSVTLTPTASGENAGKITDKVYVRAYSAIAHSNGYSGDITISGTEITTPQKITVSSTVTCQEYELKTNDRGTVTTAGNYYTGATVTAPADPTGVCTEPINYVFDGWSATEVTDGATSYTKVDFSKYTMPKGGATLYAVYKYAADGSSSPQKVSAENIVDGGKYYITASYSGTEYILKASNFVKKGSGDHTTKFDVTTATESLAWTFVKSGDNWSIKSGDYVLGTTDDNTALSSLKTNTQTWTCTTTTTTYINITTTIKTSTNSTDRRLALYGATNPDWRTYKASYAGTDAIFDIQLYTVSTVSYKYTSSPACGVYITGTKGIQVTSAKDIWVEAADTMEVSATSLDKNEDGAAVSISAEVTSGNFTIKTAGTSGSGSSKLTLTTNCTDAAYSQKLVVVYTPTADNTIETGQILLRVYKTGGTTEYATATIDVQGRSLPEQFVIAAKTADGWVALPSDLGIGSSYTVKAPYTITVDDESNPTKATQAPTTALYKGAERNAANTCAKAIRFRSVSNNAYLQASTAANNTGIWLSTTNSNEAQPWKLTSSDFADYNVRVEKSETGRYLGYDATQGKIANYKQTATLRFLPVETTCTRYDAPSIKSTTATSNKVTLTWTEISGATAYEYSTDQTNWSSDNLSVSTTGGITTAVISGLTATTQYTLSIRVKVTGDNCSDVTSTTFTTSDCDDVPSNLSAYASSNSVTISWTANAATSTVKIYSDAAGTTEVVSKTDAKSPCDLMGLKQSTKYYYQVFTGGSCGSAIESFTTENTDISVVEWFNDSLTVNVNTDGDVSVLIEGKKAHGSASEANIAEDLFFSKYYEATGTVKLLAIYNGTVDTISLANIKIIVDQGKGWSDSGSKVVAMNSYGAKKKGYIAPNEEIIIWTKGTSYYYTDKSSGTSVDIVDCVSGKMDVSILQNSTADLTFGGQSSIGLFRGDALIDIIGAVDSDGVPQQGNVEPSWGDDPGWLGHGYSIEDQTKEIDLSTNRCLLIRSNNVKSGVNAVTKNSHSKFESFTKEEWLGRQVSKDNEDGTNPKGAQSSCDGFAYVAGYDYSGYYTTYDSIGGVNQTEIQGHKNSDGTYTIPVSRVDTFACQNIRLQVKNNGTTVTSKDQKVPIIVTKSTNTTNDTLFIKKHTETECKTCDVVVRDNATLTHVDGGRKEFKDMYIYAGSHLELPDGKEFTLTTLHMHALNDNVSYAKINNDNSSTSSASITVNKLVHVKRIDGHYWYPFSLPYDCKIADIKELFGISLGTYGTDWGIKYYDGQERQQQGTASAAGQDGKHWKMMPSDGTLKAYTGYIIGLFYQNENLMRSIYFTPAGTSNYLEDGTDKTTEVTNWKDNLNADKRHHGWNFVGSPYISLFGEGTSGQGLNNTNVKMGYTNTETGEQVDADHVYVTIPNGKDSKTYTQKLAADVTIYPFTAYFVQAIDPTDEQSHQLELTYSKGNRSLNAAPRRIASATTDKTIFVELNIDNGDLHDNAGVLVSDQYTTDYEIGSDLIKMYAADAKPQLYTTDIEQSKMAYQSMPDSRAQNIPLGIYVPAAGTYTLSINNNISELDAAQAVYLLHDNDIVANLLFTDYDITAAAAGTISGYALDIRRAQGVATEVSTVNGTQMSIYDGILTISNLPANATVQVYDMLGRVLTNTTANAEVLTVPVHTTGVYTICITSGEQQIVTKTIIR